MRVIWKHPLQVSDAQTVMLPAGAEILTLQMQDDVPTIWFMCDPDEYDTENRIIHIYGTGHNMPYRTREEQNYLGTFQMDDGTLVFHAFEVMQ